MLNNLSPKTNLSTSVNIDIPPLTQLEPCRALRIIGFYFVIIFVAGTLLNGSLLFTLARNRRLRRLSTNILIGGLLFADFIGSCLEVPLPALSLIRCRWIFNKITCTFEGFISYFIGCSNIYILCLISIDRYNIVTRPVNQSMKMNYRAYLSIGCAYMLSLFWTSMPLFGWSFYDYEGIGVSCSIKWTERSVNVISYNISILIFVYFAPVIIILVANLKIYQLIRIRRQPNTANLHQSFIRRRHAIERRILTTLTLVIGGFLVAWTPYAILILIQVFINIAHIPPIMITIPALIAKTSFIWNPLILTVRNEDFRRHLPKLTYYNQRSDSNRDTRVMQAYVYQESTIQ
ncbi:unnamed protein product [Rotaria socialis]|uniref:G-protein coupled receptors family 1 profile domain-containing protein n=1 Tax=Rotaria socialis TaxID=392032 RepID=A0A821CEW9_9BILA|nr:unnamed protein product [Rotaria socialis]CAF3517511.1 unnamed protein product [Rotaria socialis]CAF3561218.1 unnamed protein product [Rotaria socialis]CAF3774648.1 unnamed protein product [Rotaria socialis]CAF4253271.1 unnamed protein product [Rotaria socialis]